MSHLTCGHHLDSSTVNGSCCYYWEPGTRLHFALSWGHSNAHPRAQVKALVLISRERRRETSEKNSYSQAPTPCWLCCPPGCGRAGRAPSKAAPPTKSSWALQPVSCPLQGPGSQPSPCQGSSSSSGARARLGPAPTSHRQLMTSIRTEEARGSAGDSRPGRPLSYIAWLEVVRAVLGLCAMGKGEQ